MRLNTTNVWQSEPLPLWGVEMENNFQFQACQSDFSKRQAQNFELSQVIFASLKVCCLKIQIDLYTYEHCILFIVFVFSRLSKVKGNELVWMNSLLIERTMNFLEELFVMNRSKNFFWKTKIREAMSKSQEFFAFLGGKTKSLLYSWDL